MADWYVVQVRGGQENAVVAALRRTAGTGALEECFSPRWRTQRKIRGEWQSVERLLLPGYVVAVTDAPRELDEALRRVPGFTRLLRNERGFTPLDTRRARTALSPCRKPSRPGMRWSSWRAR